MNEFITITRASTIASRVGCGVFAANQAISWLALCFIHTLPRFEAPPGRHANPSNVIRRYLRNIGAFYLSNWDLGRPWWVLDNFHESGIIAVDF